MIDNWARERLPRWTTPLVSACRSAGISANSMSGIGFAFALAAAAAVASGQAGAAIGLWWTGRLADALDGSLARATGSPSHFGAYLDILLDMLAYSVMILGFAFLHPEWTPAWGVILVLYVACITSALALGQGESATEKATRDNRGLRLGAGLAEAGETGLAYTLFLLFPDWLAVWVPLWIGTLLLTVAARTLLARRVLQ